MSIVWSWKDPADFGMVNLLSHIPTWELLHTLRNPVENSGNHNWRSRRHGDFTVHQRSLSRVIYFC